MTLTTKARKSIEKMISDGGVQIRTGRIDDQGRIIDGLLYVEVAAPEFASAALSWLLQFGLIAADDAMTAGAEDTRNSVVAAIADIQRGA